MRTLRGMRTAWSRLGTVLMMLLAGSAAAVELRWREGTVRGYPVMVDPATGKVVAWGEHVQRVVGNRLLVSTVFKFNDGRRIEEQLELDQGQQLSQRKWLWREKVGGDLRREFRVDFTTGQASAIKVENATRQEWKGKVDVKAGEAFAGAGFMFAIKNVTERLREGESVELTAVAFMPKPRTVKVKVFAQGKDTVRVAGRNLPADHIIVRPQVPWVAKAFVKVPDHHLWFHSTPPAAFLRAEGMLMEPSDMVVRTEVEAPVGNGARRAARAAPAEKRAAP
ncbi:MAG TPA: hypothetical protein VK447_15710 [Myxococcaceae bacterium]|nr:hypothetical protein [Myxococcaceae bacterium]